MGVRAPQGGHPAIQIVGQRQLFAGGLGVDLHQRKRGLILRFQQLVRRKKRIFRVKIQVASANQGKNRNGNRP